MSESYFEYEVTGDAGPGYPPYNWRPIARGSPQPGEWTEKAILETVSLLTGEADGRCRVTDLRVRRRLVIYYDWEDVPPQLKEPCDD